jgi:hypothetical protein
MKKKTWIHFSVSYMHIISWNEVSKSIICYILHVIIFFGIQTTSSMVNECPVLVRESQNKMQSRYKWENNIKTNLLKVRLTCKLDSVGVEYGPIVRYFERCSKHSGSIQGGNFFIKWTTLSLSMKTQFSVPWAVSAVRFHYYGVNEKSDRTDRVEKPYQRKRNP